MEEKGARNDKYVYVLVNDFPKLLRAGESLERIAIITFSENQAISGIPVMVYQDFKSAADASRRLYKKTGMDLQRHGQHHKYYHTGIAKIKIDERSMGKELTQEEFIDGLESITHTNGIIITRAELDALTHEQQEEEQIAYESDVEEERFITQSILKDISGIPPKLRYLLFVDFELFHHCKENWIDYEFRERRCVKNLFDTTTTILELYSDPKIRTSLTLEIIDSLHLQLSKGLVQMEVEGNALKEYRTIYNGFPIFKDTSTVEGITELLFRIRKDNNAKGFMLGSPSKTEFSNREEFIAVIEDARNNALACAGETSSETSVNIKNFSDEQIVELAQKIYQKIKNGEPVYILTPEPKLAYEYALNAVKTYNEEIKHAITVQDKIKAIDKLTHELEILHLYYDVNLRTNYLLTNLLLISNGIKWTILYNPNRIDLYSEQQRIKEIKKGIFRFEYLMKNQEEMLKEYDELNHGLAKEFRYGNLGFYHPFQREDKLKLVKRASLKSSDPEGDIEREMKKFDQGLKEEQDQINHVVDNWSKTYEEAEESLNNFLRKKSL
ncbi:hypothetical protein LEAN103870_10620 [Legionella anisa]|uniref:Fido domain-containing protein n=1 Tax=Legionella anisa TaxID=28082 RepID=A0AAX0WS95_9GAMM|nr:hypothetical protein [Legionella anisa]AWN74828.1 hypothetical protein DLD14_13835 [Legionella anisa]KTC77697.1 ankyrin repeat-containing protein [Legionella anisa]MBN5937603.1 hypothetical protein [Legionella anisa]MCW8424973.1 hypothetical protein [Legionella anisa]MCW8445907.1 hypothetical protein [Legionella anisa]